MDRAEATKATMPCRIHGDKPRRQAINHGRGCGTEFRIKCVLCGDRTEVRAMSRSELVREWNLSQTKMRSVNMSQGEITWS